MKTRKKHFMILANIALAFTLFNCNNDDDGAIPIQENETTNQAPEAFTLIAVSDGATEVDVKPEFLWNAAVDPDGDTLSYELLMDGNNSPTTSMASNINGTTFTLEDRLPLNENLFWKVTATDNEGLMTSSNTFGFTTRNLKIPSTPETTNAAFPERSSHTSVVFDDKIWVIGGYDGVSHLNDVWQSTDGITWTQVTAEAPFHKRSGHTSVVFDDKIWVIGGYTGVDYLRDIWQSTDGETWIKITGASPFPQRGLHSAVAFKDKLWIIGSLDESAKISNNIWQSSDGETWTPVNSVAPFPERYNHTTVVFDGKIWIIGGDTFNGLLGILNDVWQSADGSIWTEVTEEAAFDGVKDHTTAVFDNKMWVIGGRDSRLNSNDIWQSSDGISWSQVIEEIPFTKRTGHTTVIFNDKIWVIGGSDASSFLNDVWAMD